jgi:hypothetical protein
MQARRERITFAIALFMVGAGAMSGVYMGFAACCILLLMGS